MPESLKKSDAEEPKTAPKEKSVDVKIRKGISTFWDKFKANLIDMFKEDEDNIIR